jgi:hypothetical protein
MNAIVATLAIVVNIIVLLLPMAGLLLGDIAPIELAPQGSQTRKKVRRSLGLS